MIDRFRAFSGVRPPVVIALVLLIGVAGMALFAAISSLTIDRQVVLSADADIAETFFTHSRDSVLDVFDVITMLGSEVLWVLSFGVGGYFISRRQWARLVVWALAMGVGKLINIGLKNGFDRARPAFEGWINPESTFGYPSGHAMMSIIAYGMLAYFAVWAVRHRRVQVVIVVGAAVIVALVALSRIVLSVHYLSDVIGGLIAGGWWLIVCIALMEVARARDGAA